MTLQKTNYIKELNQNTLGKGFIFLVATTAMIMAAATIIDHNWTAALAHNKWPALMEIMGRSVFEGELPGVNDPVILVLLAAVVVYYLGWRWPNLRWFAAWRPQAGFIIATSLITAIYLVHSLKWMIGRARPDLVFQHDLPYTYWFVFGPHFITEGIFSGAFPSGHTAQAFILMTAAYALAGDPLLSKPIKWAGWLWGALVLVLSLLMGISRCMSLSHWLTDVLGSVFLGWILMHLIYFKILRVPDQHHFWVVGGHLPDLPPMWEVVLCLHLLWFTLGTMMTVIGLRAVFSGYGLAFVPLVLLGAIFIWFSVIKARRLYHKVITVLRGCLGTASE